MLEFITIIQLVLRVFFGFVSIDLEALANDLPQPNLKESAYIEGFEVIHQFPELPSGCEITTLTQTLNYYGYNVSKTYMADNYLTTAPLGTSDFYNAFMGDPYTDWSYGCYAPVIENDAADFFNDNQNSHRIVNISSSSADTLYSYVSQGTPVMVWITISMLEPYLSYVWDLNGKPVYFMSQEHCSTLIGYDLNKRTVYIADTYRGYIREFSMDIFEKRYEQMGRMALIILES